NFLLILFFFSSRRRHTRSKRDWSSDVCSSDLKKPAEKIEIGETIVIKPGDRIPLDGEITSGYTSINEAPITGESIPVDKTDGDIVFAGTINDSGSIEVKVTKHPDDTAIARIIHQVEEAQEQRAPAQAFIDRFPYYYTPVVFIIALSLIIIPPILGLGSWYDWIYRGLALLIVEIGRAHV